MRNKVLWNKIRVSTLIGSSIIECLPWRLSILACYKIAQKVNRLTNRVSTLLILADVGKVPMLTTSEYNSKVRL